MKNLPLRFLWAALVGLALLAPSPLLAAEKFTPGQTVATLSVPAGLNQTDVKDVLVASLLARQWTVKDKTDNKVVGHLLHRGLDATLTFTFDASQISVTCESWKVDKKGNRGAPELPKGWIENLKKDIPKRLNQRAASK